jgi:hypothetical protein
VLKIGNRTRFALELYPLSGVDLRHRSGGIDLGVIGSRGPVAGGGETTEWSLADGSDATFAAEFTEYAFLRQVATWVIDLLPAGSEVLETGKDLADAVSILKDALGVTGGLRSLLEHLYAGDYRAAFSDVAGLLTQEAVVQELVDRGFFERLGYRLGEGTVEELFKALQVAGHLADLGDLLWTTWQTGGYVHGEMGVRLPEAEAGSTTAPAPSPVPATGGEAGTTTTTRAPATTGGAATTTEAATTTTAPATTAPATTAAAGEPEYLGSVTASETPHTFRWRMTDAQAAAVAAGARVLVASYSADDPESTFAYGGWEASLQVNGAVVYQWQEFDGTDSRYWDAGRGETMYGGTGVDRYLDVTDLVLGAGPDVEFRYDHNNEGPGIGIKVLVAG